VSQSTAGEHAMNKFWGILSVVSVALLTFTADAQTAAEFYRGKQVHLIVGYPAGSGLDISARALGANIGRHIPGTPIVVIENMVGAASLQAANYLYEKAPRDGTYIGTISHDMLVAPLLEAVNDGNLRFDALKFGWLGSPSRSVLVGFVSAKTGIKNFRDLYARETVVATATPGSESYLISNLLNRLLGTKLKIVAGYPGSNDMFLAIERGEVEGFFGGSLGTLMATRPEWLKQGTITMLVQMALEREPSMPEIPLIMDFATSEQMRQTMELILAPGAASRPFLAPPGVPADRVQALRAAFDATMTDPVFRQDAEKSKMEVEPMSGAAIDKMLSEIYASPPEVVAAARDALKFSH
jgi:tripartite-type tricarboxylate transporter receptor subunit TctC